jgi:hypothetical protein
MASAGMLNKFRTAAGSSVTGFAVQQKSRAGAERRRSSRRTNDERRNAVAGEHGFVAC